MPQSCAAQIAKATGVKRDRIAYLLLGSATFLVVCALTAAVLYGPLP
jgi:hypothetical protein